MPQVIDLATLKNKNKAEEPTAESDGTKQPVSTALVLIKDTDGRWQATPDLSVVERIDPQEVPDGQDMIAGLNIMLSDIQAEKTANMTVVMMQQFAQAQVQQMQNAQIAHQLNLPKG